MRELKAEVKRIREQYEPEDGRGRPPKPSIAKMLGKVERQVGLVGTEWLDELRFPKVDVEAMLQQARGVKERLEGLIVEMETVQRQRKAATGRSR